MSNTALKLLTLLFLAGYLGALLWAFPLRRGLVPMLAVNIVTAGLVLAYQAPRLPFTLRANDLPVMALILFELLTLALALLALRGMRFPLLASLLPFGLNGLACLAFTVFAFTFRMTRLF